MFKEKGCIALSHFHSKLSQKGIDHERTFNITIIIESHGFHEHVRPLATLRNRFEKLCSYKQYTIFNIMVLHYIIHLGVQVICDKADCLSRMKDQVLEAKFDFNTYAIMATSTIL